MTAIYPSVNWIVLSVIQDIVRIKLGKVFIVHGTANAVTINGVFLVTKIACFVIF